MSCISNAHPRILYQNDFACRTTLNKCYMTTYHNNLYKTCIDACNHCAFECEHCATECLKENSIEVLSRCIALARECAIVCTATSRLMSVGGENAALLCNSCYVICTACAEECESDSKELEYCKRGAEACRKCGGRAPALGAAADALARASGQSARRCGAHRCQRRPGKREAAGAGARAER